MASDHARAVALAEEAGEELRALFEQVGGVEAPQGAVWRAYRVGRQALGEGFTAAALQDVTGEVYARVQDTAVALLGEAAQLGAGQAREQLRAYGLAAGTAELDPVIGAAQEAVLGGIAQLHRQIVLTYVATGDPALIIGDGTRVGAFGPAPAAATLTRWLTTTHQAAFAEVIAATPRAARFKRQAVATLSRRTTLCCLQVHGQIVDLGHPFTLTGTPRYADRLMHAPFHAYCRTTEALVPADRADDQVTQQMRTGARAELRARARGQTTQVSRSPSALTP